MDPRSGAGWISLAKYRQINLNEIMNKYINK
jgi:hypothetical protein